MLQTLALRQPVAQLHCFAGVHTGGFTASQPELVRGCHRKDTLGRSLGIWAREGMGGKGVMRHYSWEEMNKQGPNSRPK